ncbi:MAG: 30S ribosomal protein S4 [Patescibacteria group bacterium]
MRYTGPKNKLARRIGEDLGLKTNPLKVAKRLAIAPGMHGKKQKKKMSDYGIQLKEKQKVKYIYGLSEKQMRKMYDTATKTPTATGSAMLRLLERRLDNVLFRMKFAPTRASARQLVNHGHVKVNQRKMTIPSYLVSIDDLVELKASGSSIPAVSQVMKEGTFNSKWIEVKAAIGKIKRLPEREEIDGAIDEQLIVEWYSR